MAMLTKIVMQKGGNNSCISSRMSTKVFLSRVSFFSEDGRLHVGLNDAIASYKHRLAAFACLCNSEKRLEVSEEFMRIFFDGM